MPASAIGTRPIWSAKANQPAFPLCRMTGNDMCSFVPKECQQAHWPTCTSIDTKYRRKRYHQLWRERHKHLDLLYSCQFVTHIVILSINLPKTSYMESLILILVRILFEAIYPVSHWLLDTTHGPVNVFFSPAVWADRSTGRPTSSSSSLSDHEIRFLFGMGRGRKSARKYYSAPQGQHSTFIYQGSRENTLRALRHP